MDDEKDKDEGKGSKSGERIRKQAVFFLPPHSARRTYLLDMC
jgi:hypothetical protein